MPPRRPTTDWIAVFRQGAGDELLLEALEEVPSSEAARNSKSWLLPDNTRVHYSEALAYTMNKANETSHRTEHHFTAPEITQRIDMLDNDLRRRNMLSRSDSAAERKAKRASYLRQEVLGIILQPAQPVLSPAHALHHSYSSVSYPIPPPMTLEPSAYASGPAGHYAEYGYHGQQSGNENEEYPAGVAESAPYTLQPPYNGPSGPSNPYNTYYRSLGRGCFPPRPLRHAVIYGEGRRRF
ncbi:hypothetical protein JCM8547_000004 [Rhodosporidiobolus lusitaniae]